MNKKLYSTPQNQIIYTNIGQQHIFIMLLIITNIYHLVFITATTPTIVLVQSRAYNNVMLVFVLCYNIQHRVLSHRRPSMVHGVNEKARVKHIQDKHRLHIGKPSFINRVNMTSSVVVNKYYLYERMFKKTKKIVKIIWG